MIIIERRSKTPNTFQNTEPVAQNLPLRSKTPTIDRYSTSIPTLPPIPPAQHHVVKTVSKPADNYLYLNQVQQQGNNTNKPQLLTQSKSVSGISTLSSTAPGTGPSNANNIIFNPQDLYSTVSKQQIINKNNSHPIDTNEIHLNQLKENHQLFSDEYDSNMKNKMNSNQANATLRSKTPGPELFRDRTNLNNMSANNIHFRPPYQQQFQTETDQIVSPPTKYNTISSNQQQQRSKTPTADLYYSQNQRNDYNFDTIYQPFVPRSQQSQHMYQHHIKDTTSQTDIYDSSVDFKTIDIIVELLRQENGFGFRIVGGDEEGSQVAVGFIVPNGSADLDGRLKPNDEIIMIDNENVVGASHKRVVKLMTIAALNRKVKLWVKRKVPITTTSGKFNSADDLFEELLLTFYLYSRNQFLSLHNNLVSKWY